MNDRINDLLDLIDQYIKLNGNQEITGDIANLVLNEIVLVLNEIIGNSDDLNTINKNNLVGAINELMAYIGTIQSAADNNVVLSQDYLNLGVLIGQMQSDFNMAVDNKLANLPSFEKIEETPIGVNVLGRLTANSYVGRCVNQSISGSFNIDFNDLSDQYILTLTGSSTIAFSNMITDAQTAVICISVTGNYSFSLPSFLNPLPSNDDYDGAILNEIVINIKRGGATPLGYYSLVNID